MMLNKKNPPVVPLDAPDTDESRELTGEDLKFNEDENSFELDVETGDDEYQHPDPYDTSASNGEDDNSTYDEENRYTPDEYRDKGDELKGELQELEEVTDDTLMLDEKDEQLSETPEDERGDLDEEGYPVRDDAGGDNNPILERSDEDNGGPNDDDESETEVPPFEDPRREDDVPIGDDPNRDIPPAEMPPTDERDPLGDKQIQSDDPTETTG